MKNAKSQRTEKESEKIFGENLLVILYANLFHGLW
jgi:hypothetical protein